MEISFLIMLLLCLIEMLLNNFLKDGLSKVVKVFHSFVSEANGS